MYKYGTNTGSNLATAPPPYSPTYTNPEASWATPAANASLVVGNVNPASAKPSSINLFITYVYVKA